jgi:RsiW-degrading membrane proteinase PrsW (M82 family)
MPKRSCFLENTWNFGQQRNLEKMNEILNYPLYFFFATLPSLLWLNFYLKEDQRPEPKSMVLKVFLFGMIFAFLALFLEKFLIEGIEIINFPQEIADLIKIFLVVAFVEEFLKFLVVRDVVFESKELDEPIDCMIYMIISGLGFAATENLLLLFPFKSKFLGEIFQISFLRFVSATFLHALSSAIVGFFIGLSFFRKEERLKLISFGLFFATLLHGLYNFSIIEFGEKVGLSFSAILILISAYSVSKFFKGLRE